MKFLAFSNDIICTATPAQCSVTFTMCCMIFQKQQPWIQATSNALRTKSMWAHRFFKKKTEAALIVNIASHEQPTIKLTRYKSSLSDGFITVNALIMTSFMEPLLFVVLILALGMSLQHINYHYDVMSRLDKSLGTWWAFVCWVRRIRQMAVNHSAF